MRAARRLVRATPAEVAAKDAAAHNSMMDKLVDYYHAHITQFTQIPNGKCQSKFHLDVDNVGITVNVPAAGDPGEPEVVVVIDTRADDAVWQFDAKSRDGRRLVGREGDWFMHMLREFLVKEGVS